MLVNKINNNSNLSFKRKPSASEMKRYSSTVSHGLKVLDKNLGLIIHNSSVPSKEGYNFGIGSLFSINSEKNFLPFLKVNGIKFVQQEPDTLRTPSNPSPYSPQASTKNDFMLPIERLATEEYDNLLKKEDIDNMVAENMKRPSPEKVDYVNVSQAYNTLLSKAYSNFMKKEKFSLLKQEFLNYKNKNLEELKPSAIYEVLLLINNKIWSDWPSEEKYLYKNSNTKLIEEIFNNNQEKINLYVFKQWLINREIDKAKLRNAEQDIRYIGDSPVGWSNVEVWMNQDLFLKEWAMGCPPDNFSKAGQRWGFAVLKPETIFNSDGSLGKGGELIKQRYEKMFKSNDGGIRIDHIIGLIDPFVYRIDRNNMDGENSGRLYSSPNHPILGKYAKKENKHYFDILKKIVIPAAESVGLTKNDIICEDLGTLTPPVIEAMKELELRGISITQYDMRGKDVPEKNIIMLGSHDNESYIEYTNNVFNDKNYLNYKSDYLALDTKIPEENLEDYKNNIKSNKTNFISASFAELFTSPAKYIQIFFTSFFGIPETYNKPGTTSGCWTLRLPDNFENLYWENVRKGLAINLPEAIARAIRHKGSAFANQNRKLLNNLDEFTQILKS